MEKFNSEKNIIHGPPPLQKIDDKISLGIMIYEKLRLHRHSEALAFVHAITNKAVTYKEVFEGSCRLAVSLQRCGFGTKSVIALFCENHLNFAVPFLSALYIAAPLTPISPTSTARELLYFLNIAKPKVIFCSKSTLGKVLEVRAKYSFQKVIVLDDGKYPDGVESVNELINKKSTPIDSMKFYPTEVNPKEDVVFIIYSSGTTGLPKGVMLTHWNLVARTSIASDPRWFGTLARESVDLAYLPFCHVYGLITILWALSEVKVSVVFPTFDLELVLSNIEKYKVHHMFAVPPVAVILCKSPLVDKYDLSSLKIITCGGAPLHKDIQDALKKRFGKTLETVCQGYGLTESTGTGIISPERAKSGSIGVPLPLMSAKVIDLETNEILGPNEAGELCLKGDYIMKGYVDNPTATRNIIDGEGWLHTGDVAYYDDEGYFYIVDRVKELIKCKGHQVAPAELEAVLLTHPKIQDAAVIGIPDTYYGEKPIAFVVKHPGQELHEKDVLEFVKREVSREKRIYDVKFTDAIPRSSSGKILRRILRDLFPQTSKL